MGFWMESLSFLATQWKGGMNVQMVLRHTRVSRLIKTSQVDLELNHQGESPFLILTFKAFHTVWPNGLVFRGASFDPLSPHVK